MKKAVLELMRRTGAFTPFRLANRGKAIVLMYHRFSNQEDGSATPARAFQSHLDYLTRRYHLVPLSHLAELLSRGGALPPGLAAITIDDGYRDAYEIALPLLRRYKVPAAIFVVTDFIDGKKWLWTDKLRFIVSRTRADSIVVRLGDSLTRLPIGDPQSRRQAASQLNSLLKWQPEARKEEALGEIARALGVEIPAEPPAELGPLTWDQLRELDAAGVEAGSHTVSHPILTRVNPLQLRTELVESKARLEAMLGREVDMFCYPNGDYDETVVGEVGRAGYRFAVSADYGFNGPASKALLLRRIPAQIEISRFAQSTSGFEGARMMLRSRYAASAGPPECLMGNGNPHLSIQFLTPKVGGPRFDQPGRKNGAQGN